MSGKGPSTRGHDQRKAAEKPLGRAWRRVFAERGSITFSGGELAVVISARPNKRCRKKGGGS
jgi:hypothetical protein